MPPPSYDPASVAAAAPAFGGLACVAGAAPAFGARGAARPRGGPPGVAALVLALVAGCAADSDPDRAGASASVERVPRLVASPAVGPEFPNARLGLSAPEPGERFAVGEPIEVGFVLSGFTLREPTPGGDMRGIARAPEGQHIHLVVDDRPYEAIYDVAEAFVLEGLEAGTHVLRAFPGRDWHESVKAPGALAQRVIVVGDDEAALPPPEEWGPSVVYSRPQGTYEGAAADSILVDFYLSGVRLAEDGHRVRLVLNEDHTFHLSEWAPHLLLDVPNGEHVLRLELLDPSGVPVPAPFTPVERRFEVRR